MNNLISIIKIQNMLASGNAEELFNIKNIKDFGKVNTRNLGCAFKVLSKESFI